MSRPLPTFGDRVRIVSAPATVDAGWADREGTCLGWTTPSVSGVEVIGLTESDFAVNVGVEMNWGVNAWFDTSLVEVIDHSPGTVIRVGDQSLIRDADGNWIPDPPN